MNLLKHKILTSSFVMLAIFFLYFAFVNKVRQKPAPNVTLKGAYTLLKSKVKVPDLAYMAFDSQNMTQDGKTKKFLISGCSPSLKKTFYMLSNGTKINSPRSIKTKACTPTLPYDKMMDSPQVLAKVRRATGKTCTKRIIYKMDWNDPQALILCWDPEKQVAQWQVVVDTVTGKIVAVYEGAKVPQGQRPTRSWTQWLMEFFK
jgi:hypothetical protein